MDVFQGPYVEGLYYQPVSEILGQKHFQTLVAELLVLRPVLALALSGAGFNLDIITYSGEPFGAGILLCKVD